IVAVGSAADVAVHIGPRTRVVDLAGRLLLPGFQDVHVHPIFAGVDRLQCDLRDARGRDGVLDVIRAYVAGHPDDEWIIGSGWSMADFENGTPRRKDLDAIVPDRPAFFPNRDGHSTWVNSKTLELAGIDRDTLDPDDGRIERDPDGTPTGCLHEGAANAVERLMPAITSETMSEGLRIAQAYLHSLGITGWQDAIVRPEDQAVYRAAADAGWLTARVEAAMWWDRARGDDQIEELIERSRTGSLGRLRANSVKLMQDGVLETFTGAMIDPYLGADGTPTTNRGISFIDPERLPGWVTRLDAAGLQPHFHAIGDRAVRECLDAVAAARSANGPSDTRPHIAHIQVIHPDDVPRFAALDVVANAQALWAAHEGQMDLLTIPFLGPERTTWQYPFGGLLRSGARLAMGSDWSVSTPDPLQAIAVAVTRSAPTTFDSTIDTSDWEPFLPEQALTVEEAVRAYTSGSAWVNHRDVETGTIEVGKLADLTVIDRDLFAADEHGLGHGRSLTTFIGGARALATWVGGASVFEDPTLG
ncbi:MAG: amidohydrolase, partial [Candidatus Limnocylindrales bacterium]